MKTNLSACAPARPLYQRIFCAAAAVLLAVTLCLAAAPRAYADSGDLDEIENYQIDVTPDTDGSLAITATVDWKVLDSSSEGPLEWVQIGLPNEAVENLSAVTTDTIREIYRDGEYAHITFDQSYYEGETVHFSYSWTQRYMYTLGADGSVSYTYTPGWFDSANVGSMQITWHYNNAAPDAATAGADCGFTESNTADGYIVKSASTLAHSDKMTVTLHYLSWPAALDTGMSAENYNSSDYESDDDEGFVSAVIIMITISFVIIVILSIMNSAFSYVGGFYDRSVPHYRRRGGLYYDCDYRGIVAPGAVGHAVPPAGARAFSSMGGGHSHGGGGGRSGGGCACASSCACACACAGGGRAGCSAKNLYGAIHMKDSILAAGLAPDESKKA
jgi:hypothetical protein